MGLKICTTTILQLTIFLKSGSVFSGSDSKLELIGGSLELIHIELELGAVSRGWKELGGELARIANALEGSA